MSEAITIVRERIEEWRAEGYDRDEITVYVAPEFYRVLRATIDYTTRIESPDDVENVLVDGVTVEESESMSAVFTRVDDA